MKKKGKGREGKEKLKKIESEWETRNVYLCIILHNNFVDVGVTFMLFTSIFLITSVLGVTFIKLCAKDFFDNVMQGMYKMPRLCGLYSRLQAEF